MNDSINQSYDLGLDMYGSGVGIPEIEEYIRTTAYDTPDIPCIYCGKESIYKIIPKKKLFRTPDVDTIGYVCEECLKMQRLDKNKYGIRKL